MEELVDLYFEQIKPGRHPNQTWRSRTLQSIQRLIQNGWTKEAIKDRIYQAASEHPHLDQVYYIDEIFPDEAAEMDARLSKRPGNLIKEGKDYYHYELYHAPEPYLMRINIADGSIIKRPPRRRKRLKSYYSAEDLLNFSTAHLA